MNVLRLVGQPDYHVGPTCIDTLLHENVGQC